MPINYYKSLSFLVNLPILKNIKMKKYKKFRRLCLKLFINQLTLNFDCNKLFNKKDVSNFIIASKNQIFNRNNALTFFL